jgi:hypothetical protein
MPKRDLNSALAKPQETQPMIRGKGYELSTNNIEAPVEVAPAKEPAVKRDNAKLDPDIIQAYKLLAVQQKRKLYEVMEEALKEYLESHK